jgi:exosortase
LEQISQEPAVSRRTGGLSLWIQMIWFAGLLCLLFAPVLKGMALEWFHDDDMGHGVFVPLVAGWMAWQKRGELARASVKPCWWGLALLAWGFLQLIAGTLGVELFVARTAFIVSVAGLVLTVWGVEVFRILAFPLFLLAFMIRIPAIVYGQVTFPLQLLASQVAETALSVIGIPVYREGNILELPSQRLSVVEACSGIRSLLSLAFLSLVYGFFFDKRLWVRLILFASTVPIAIAANAFRVTITGILGEYKKELAEGFFHAVEGWVIFMVALVLLVALHRCIIAAGRVVHARG